VFIEAVNEIPDTHGPRLYRLRSVGTNLKLLNLACPERGNPNSPIRHIEVRYGFPPAGDDWEVEDIESIAQAKPGRSSRSCTTTHPKASPMQALRCGARWLMIPHRTRRRRTSSCDQTTTAGRGGSPLPPSIGPTHTSGAVVD
jgi:hypothetical protein